VRIRVTGTQVQCQDMAALLRLVCEQDGLGVVADVSPFVAHRRRPHRHPRVGTRPAPAPGPDFVSLADLAVMAGVAASTLRAYLSRGEAGLPAPDARKDTRRGWTRATATAWVASYRGPDLGAVYLTVLPVTATARPAPRQEP
jgi:hypothetical protein